MAIQSLRGTSDLMAADVKLWSAVEHRVRHLTSLYGYQTIRTPIIEEAALFLRSVGETTDIVQKELFRLADRGGHDVVLRPEGTAPIVRAYLEHQFHKTEGFAKFFYLGPMFRAERPQAGRSRQFHQFGVEAIGCNSPWVDVEVIALCISIMRECGLREISLWLMSMGCRKDQARSAKALRERLSPHRGALCKDCQGRFEKNVFRVLDCRKPSCQEIARKGNIAPFLLCPECTEHFDVVRGGLKDLGIAFDDTRIFARGLDYYTRTVFEVRVKGLGAQDAVAAGGRYDHLVEELGGPPMGAVGFAAGLERMLMATEGTQAKEHCMPERKNVYTAITKSELLPEGFRIAQELRNEGVGTLMDFDGKSLKAQLREADKFRCRLVAIIGEAELKSGMVTIKDLEQGTQEAIALKSLAKELAKRLEKTSCH